MLQTIYVTDNVAEARTCCQIPAWMENAAGCAHTMRRSPYLQEECSLSWILEEPRCYAILSLTYAKLTFHILIFPLCTLDICKRYLQI